MSFESRDEYLRKLADLRERLEHLLEGGLPPYPTERDIAIRERLEHQLEILRLLEQGQVDDMRGNVERGNPGNAN